MVKSKSKFILGKSTLLLTIFIGLLSLLNQAVYPQIIAPQLNLWQKIFKPVRDPEPPVKPRKGGSRPGQSVCLVSPDFPTQTRIIWNTQPLFIWKNSEVTKDRRTEVKKIAIEALDNHESKNRDFKAQIVTGKQSIPYQGEALKPGQSYKLLIFLNQESNSPTMFVPFQIMGANQRNRISRELMLLEKLQKNQGANAETIALAKAQYFANQGLWSDVFQQAYSVPNPSPQLSQIIKDLPNQLCD
ncbi:hypothetical protein NIES4101_85840 [Calothrix sp. NIES-4101]|nr:hypothetical protein NIES4101_85840 [Calothrix sp. NIES-4101]